MRTLQSIVLLQAIRLYMRVTVVVVVNFALLSPFYATFIKSRTYILPKMILGISLTRIAYNFVLSQGFSRDIYRQ